MKSQHDRNEAEKIDVLVEEAETLLEKVDSKKDLKENRKILKQTLFEGSEKLKHVIPKGKHL